MINADISLNEIDTNYSNGEFSILDINEVPYFDEEAYDLSNEKQFKKYLDEIERCIRNSYEYRSMMSYLKNMMGMDECSVIDGATSRNDSKVHIELHHSPFTLYDIVLSIVRRRMANNEDLSIWAVAYEAMYLHYAQLVGIIPLSKTAHELVHNGYLFIPTDKAFGNYKPYVNLYHDYIEPETLDALNTAEKITEKGIEEQLEMFNNHNIYVNAEGSYNAIGIPTTKAIIKDRIEDIKNKREGIPQKELVEMCVIVNKQ